MEASEKVKGALGEMSRRPRFRRAVTTVAHLCGLILRGKRYIERSPVVQWATFHLKRQIQFRSDLSFNVNDYSRKQFKKKGFEKLLHNCPEQRRQEDILQIQACLRTNRAFQCLPIKTQLQLCQVFIYQKYETGTILLRQGHVATECYLVLSGKLEFMMADENTRIFTSETLLEAKEGDFLGETCLLTNARRPASVLCKSEVEVVVIDKENFKSILLNIQSEKHEATCHFLRKLPLFSTWPPEKIGFLLHCSLQRFYRAGTIVVTNSQKSNFLVIVKSGRCMEVAKLNPKHIDTENATWKTARCKYEKEKPQSAAAPYCSPEGRKDTRDLEEKDKQKQRKDDNEKKKTYSRKKVGEASLGPQFLKIRTLEQSDIFGLADMMDKFCDFQLSLISEGAECIFIPQKLFLEGAPSKSRRIALEMLNSCPTESMILESYSVQQAWNAYKTELIRQQFERRAKPVSMNVSSR